MRFADTHAHLSASAFATDRESVVGEALKKLEFIVDVSTDRPTSSVSLDLSGRHTRVFSTVGVHPHAARLYDEKSLEEVVRMASGPKVVALGEMGLDYHYDFSPRQDQMRVFAWQVDRAKMMGKPVVVHIRDAFDDAFAILGGSAPPAGVLHCFTGSWEQARWALDNGLHISFAGMVTFPRGAAFRDVACKVPLDRLMLETDCPYLAPHPHRNLKRNVPEMVEVTARRIAEDRGIDLEALAQATSENARRLFNLPGGAA